MTTIETRTGEELVLARHGEDVAVAVVDDRFGRIASLRLGADAAAALAWQLLELSASASASSGDRA